MRKRHLCFLLGLAATLQTKAVSSSNAVDQDSYLWKTLLPSCAQACLSNPKDHDILGNPDVCNDLRGVRNAIYACTEPFYCGNWKAENKETLGKHVEANEACEHTVASSSSSSSSTSSKTSSITSSASSHISTLRTSSSSKTAPTSTATPTASGSTLPDSQTNTPVPIASSSSKKLSTGAIAGIVVGSLAFLALIGALLFLIFRNRRHHRKQVHSMILEPNESSGPEDTWKPMTSTAGWVTVNSTSSTPTFQAPAPTWPLQETNARSASTSPPPPSYTSAPATTRLAPLTITDINNPPAPGIAIISPVSPPTAGFRPGITEQITTNWPIPPPAPYDEAMSPVSPVSTRKTARDSDTSSIVSMDDLPPNTDYAAAAERRHTCSTPAARLLSSDSRRTSAGSTGSLARAESVAWRREVEEAAARATNRVVMNEQAAAQEAAERSNERGSKGSAIPGLDRLTGKRWSRNSVDSDFVVGTPPSHKPGGFLSGRKRVSDGSERGVYIV